MKQLSIHSLVNLLLKKTDFSLLQNEGDSSDKKITTSIRLEPNVRKFIDIQAEALGCGMNEFISMTLKAVMESSLPEKHNELDESFFRFIDVFRKHNIPLIDIPNFFDGKISRSDLNSKAALLDKLDNAIIKKTSEMFSVDEQWLKGVEGKKKFDTFSTERRWYKNFSALISRYFHYSLQGSNVSIFFLSDQKETVETLEMAKDNNESDRIDITVGLRVERPKAGSSYTFYEIWDREHWNYKATRQHLKAIVMFCRRVGLDFISYTLATDELRRVRAGEAFLSEYNLFRKAIRFEDYIINDDLNPDKAEYNSVDVLYKAGEFWRYEEPMRNRHNFKSVRELQHATMTQ